MNEMPTTTPLLLTLDEVAATLAVTRRTIERLVAADALRSVHIGRAVRVARRDLDAYVERLLREAA